jgi:hypothetical protein
MSEEKVAADTTATEQTDTTRVSGVEVKTPELSADITSALRMALASLGSLHQDILKKVSDAKGRSEDLDKRLGRLVDAGVIQSSGDHTQAFQQSIGTYIQLLQGVIGEIESEVARFGPYVSQDIPESVEVSERYKESPEEFFRAGARMLSRQARSITKHVTVSYSRYAHSFDQQEQQLARLEHHLYVNEAAKRFRERSATSEK